MPGVRAPLFPLARIHASARKSRSQTRLNRSPNRREESSPAQRCSLACIPRTLPGGRAPGFPSASSGIAAPPCPCLAYCVARCRPSPRDRLSRPPSTTAAPPRPRPSPGVAAIRPVLLAGGRSGTARGRFPRSLLSGWRARHPALPLRHRHGYPAALHRGLPPGPTHCRTRVPRPVTGASAHR
jgi:hypothetical protein